MEQITGYTPGPWIAEKPKGSNGFININPSGKGSFIATCYGTDPDPVNEANARLIAAAPEMADRIRKLEAQNAELERDLAEYSESITSIDEMNHNLTRKYIEVRKRNAELVEVLKDCIDALTYNDADNRDLALEKAQSAIRAGENV